MAEQKNEQKKLEKMVSLKESEYLVLLDEVKQGKESQEKMLRHQADLENTRKRIEKEKKEFLKYANEGLLLNLLNILDDLERTVTLAESAKEAKEELAPFLKGIEMILAHLYELLKENGVRAIDADGKIFDPNYHEALIQVENKDLPEHTIVEVLQKGYLINERVLRTAKVKVSKKTGG